MITAALTFAFVWCLFYGRIPHPFLLIISAWPAIFLAYAGRHRHTQLLSIDILAQSSRLKLINPTLKFWTLVILMIICAASKNSFTGVFLMTVTFVFAVFIGKLSINHYVHIMALPVSFLIIGGLALLFEASSGPIGVLNFNAFGFWFSVSGKSQIRTALIVSRAFGAVSCLCLLSVTTPMPDIIGVLRRARCPELIIDLMYLIYRYIFILLSLHHEMYDAAESRLGFRDYKTSLRAAGMIYSNLLARSYQFAGKNFDAMESRCYDIGIRFLECPKRVTSAQIGASAALLFVFLCLSQLSL